MTLRWENGYLQFANELYDGILGLMISVFINAKLKIGVQQ